MPYRLLVSVDELARNLDAKHWRVVDCRFNLMSPEQGRDKYREGHIPGAVYADLDKDLAAAITPGTGRHPLPDPHTFETRLAAWGIGNDSQVVAYDDSGGSVAARLWWMLRWMGHEAVAVLDGGLPEWLRLGNPLESATPPVEPAHFAARVDETRVVSTTEVMERLTADPAFALVDARDRKRFLGIAEPIDAVAGHVPGARNLPFSATLSDTGKWLDVPALQRAWREASRDSQGRDCAVMCGSGVTACHLALTAELAGFPAPRLYVGSWSEWITDPARPIARGKGGGAADSA